ncbi:hypothetical protein CCP3SC15_730002 [Gammaproteobacteria bacterium]
MTRILTTQYEDITTVSLTDGLYQDTVHIRYYGEAKTRVLFTYLEGGYLVYQCLATDPAFQSQTFKLHEFHHDGVRIISKNSPIIMSTAALALHGAYREFDLKPSVLYVGDFKTFKEVTDRFIRALMYLDLAVAEPTFKPLVIEAKDTDGFD